MRRTKNSWTAMMRRCYNPEQDHYERYGGRGIKVCKRWHLFENFLKDMGLRPNGMSLDRINNNGNYSKRNCRWATKAVQSRNTSTNRFITHNGKTLCLVDWAKECGISFRNISQRLLRGWSGGDALTVPIGGRRGERILTYKGESLPIGKWAQRLGFRSKNAIHMRLLSGWSVEKALATPRPNPRTIKYNGKDLTCGGWAKALGISRSVIKARIKSGWSAERTLTTPVRRACAAY